MKLGMNMLLWTTDVSEEFYPLFADLKETGFDGAEIPLGDHPDEFWAGIQSAMGDAGLECTTVCAVDETANPASPDAAVRTAAVDQLKKNVDLTARLGASVMCGPFHSAYKTFSGAGPTEDELAWSADVLRAAGEHAQGAGVTLAVEPLNRFECYLLNTATQGKSYIDRVGHPNVRMLYDTHHAHLEEKHVGAAIDHAAPAIGHIHISENDRGTPGTGQVNWSDSFAAFKRMNYDGWMVIEAFSRLPEEFASAIHIWRDFFPEPAEVYREGGRFVRANW